MRFHGYPTLLTAVAAAMLLTPVGELAAQNYERPPNFSAAKISVVKQAGANYTIKEPVRSDGLFRLFTLATPYGEFQVQGDFMLRMRLKELDALAELEKMSQHEQYGKALVNAGLSPIKYAGKLVTDPVNTVQNTFAGIGSFFGSIGSGMQNMGKTQDDTMSSLLGVSRERRLLAAKVGVDPYTDFEPLSVKLKVLSEAAALGGLTVTGAMMAIPGAAGIVVSNLSTANTLGDMRVEELARNYTAPQLLDLNRKRLSAMGIENEVIESFLMNRSYTPVDITTMTAALEAMGPVADKGVFVRRAAGMNVRGYAFAMRKHAEMAAKHAKTSGFVRFVALGGFPFNQTRDGAIVGVMPVDIVSWTDVTARVFGESSKDLRRIGKSGEIRLTGTATNLAKQRLKEQGWRVVERSAF